MRIFFLAIIMLQMVEILSIKSAFKVEKCNLGLDKDGYALLRPTVRLEEFFDLNEPFDGNQESTCIFIYINNIYNVDYISSVMNLNFELIEVWKNASLRAVLGQTVNSTNGASSSILIKQSLVDYVDSIYPDLIVENTDYSSFEGLDNMASYQSGFKKKKQKRNVFKQYYYMPKSGLLIKNLQFNLQIRCIISMQTYPFIDSPCKINLRTSQIGNRKKNMVNYSISNLPSFINRQFNFKKFKIQILSLNKLCDEVNRIESAYLESTNCFQLLITIQASKRFFYIHLLITLLLVAISYLSLFVPVYNHTSRVTMLTLPIVGLYLLDQLLLNDDRIIFKESTSLHIWRLACLLYIGFMFFCYVLAFYSLERVKTLVERADIGYLGYMLKCANLVQDENAFTNQLTNFDKLKKFTTGSNDMSVDKKTSLPKMVNTSIEDLQQIGQNLKSNLKNLKKPEESQTYVVTKTDSLAKMDLLNGLDLSSQTGKSKGTLSSKSSFPLKSDSLAKTDLLPANSRIVAKKVRNRSLKRVTASKSMRRTMLKNQKALLVKDEIKSSSSIPIKAKSNLIVDSLKNDVLQKLQSPSSLLKQVESNKEIEENVPKQLEGSPSLVEKSIDKTISRDSSPFAFDLKKELENLKNDLKIAKDKNTVDKQKKNTIKFLNDILGLRNQQKGHWKRKKIVSRFISSTKLKKIEFVSLIPSDQYARIAVPISFFLFLHFFALHFIF